jgi:hypothetical protein
MALPLFVRKYMAPTEVKLVLSALAEEKRRINAGTSTPVYASGSRWHFGRDRFLRRKLMHLGVRLWREICIFMNHIFSFRGFYHEGASLIRVNSGSELGSCFGR